MLHSKLTSQSRSLEAGYVVDERLTPHRPANDDGSGSVDTDYTAGVLAQINTKDNNRHLPTPFLSDADIISAVG